MKSKVPHGSLYKKNGHYYARVYYYVDGKRLTKDKATGIATSGSSVRKTRQLERAANLFLDNFLHSVSSGITIPGKDQMLADTAKAWLDHQRGSKAPGTIASYLYNVQDITLYFGTLHPLKTTDITSSDVERYLNWERMRRQPGYTGEYKVSARYADGSGVENTVLHRYTTLRSILQYAKREGLVTRNVASKQDSQISVPHPQQQEFAILPQSEAVKLLNALESEPLWFQAAVRLGLSYGLRRSEIIALRHADIDWDASHLQVKSTITQQTLDGKNSITYKPYTKNRRPKTLPLLSSTSKVLKLLVEERAKNRREFGISYDMQWDDYLICYPDGKLVSPNALTNYFSRFIRRNQLKKIRFHDLRHSCASYLYADGVDLRTIQGILGHQQLSTTMIYTHTLTDRTSDALQRMDAQLDSPEKEESEN